MLNFGGVTTWQLYEITPYSQIESSKIHQMTSYCPWLIRILISWPYMFNSSPTSKQKKHPVVFHPTSPKRKTPTRPHGPLKAPHGVFPWARFGPRMLGMAWMACTTHTVFPPKKGIFGTGTFQKKMSF